MEETLERRRDSINVKFQVNKGREKEKGKKEIRKGKRRKRQPAR